MSKPIKEMCVICDTPTGKSGICEDSLVLSITNCDIGPLCEQCYNDIDTRATDAALDAMAVELESRGPIRVAPNVLLETKEELIAWYTKGGK